MGQGGSLSSSLLYFTLLSIHLWCYFIINTANYGWFYVKLYKKFFLPKTPIILLKMTKIELYFLLWCSFRS